jgi:hypothetical protein
MLDDPIIMSFETLYTDAKIRMSTSQGQSLALAYGRSLIRLRDARMMALEAIRDEVAIALCGRAKPVFGFIAPEKEVCEVRGIKRAYAEIKGSVNGVVALIGG